MHNAPGYLWCVRVRVRVLDASMLRRNVSARCEEGACGPNNKNTPAGLGNVPVETPKLQTGAGVWMT